MMFWLLSIITCLFYLCICSLWCTVFILVQLGTDLNIFFRIRTVKPCSIEDNGTKLLSSNVISGHFLSFNVPWNHSCLSALTIIIIIFNKMGSCEDAYRVLGLNSGKRLHMKPEAGNCWNAFFTNTKFLECSDFYRQGVSLTLFSAGTHII